MSRRTLIMACSATKRSDPGLLPAIDRYQGPAWRTLRANRPPNIYVLALSAEYGLLGASAPIRHYDRKMSGRRVVELIDRCAERVRAYVLADMLGEGIDAFSFGGELYRSTLRQAVQLAELELERDIPIRYSSGGIGTQLGQLKAWLDGAWDDLERARQERLDECKLYALRFLDQGDVAGALVAFVSEAGKPYGARQAPLIDFAGGGAQTLILLGKLHLQNYRDTLAALGMDEANIVKFGRPALAFDRDMREWIKGWR